MIHLPKSSKKIQLDKTNSRILVVVAVATVVVVFCVFSVRALLIQGAYQRRVVNTKNTTVKQLQDNIKAAESLSSQYTVFESSSPNIIGGKSDVADNAPPPDGKNSRIVLDALPTQYDFPALISSLAKLLGLNGIASPTVGGTDQGSTSATQPAANPQTQSIDQIPISGTASYGAAQNLVKDLERSIRPYDITSLQISGNDAQVSISLVVNTPYQQPTAVILEKKEVK